ncbi:MAG: hypothetical protein PPFGHCPK_01431 (plasmid) [Spiroplasma endosymbiont of Drosophila atripex]|nr:MAG: hypothetical protein PPFGHCPK_01431 [Spiroplasma endosymbiont of Drosophila atripex]
MQNKKISFYIWHFVKLNPKRNQKPCINKYHQNSFFVIKRIFKENKKYIIASNYDDIFYNKYEQMQGKKWLAILLSSKDIFEYHKKIRDKYFYCKQRKFIKMLLNDFDYFFDNKDIQNVIIDIWTNNFNFEIKKYLEKILKFLDEEEWSIYFFELQKLMHEQIIKLLDWKGDFTYEKYNKVLISKLNSILSKELSEYYLIFVQKINLYRNRFSKIKPSENQQNQQLLNNWNNLTNQMKHIEAKHIYNQLLDFIDIINLILN